MHTRNKLSAKKVGSLSAPGVHGDGGGLYLRIRPSGTKSWIFVRIVDGRRRELGLGSFYDVTLAEAREEASKLRKAFREGRDPVTERKLASRERREVLTFGEFAEPFIERMVEGYRNDKHRQQWFSTVRTYAAQLYQLPITQIDTKDILDVLEPIWMTKHETANRVRQRLEKILNAAKVEGHRVGDNPARLNGHLDQLLPRHVQKVEHHSAMSYSDLPVLMKKLSARKATAARALEFLILTAARTGEVLGAVWKEIDLESRTWTIPAERMKMAQEHVVPLSGRAIVILQALRPARPDANAKIFHNGKGTGLSNMAMLQLLKRMGHSDITVHGFRSTFRDWVGEETDSTFEVAELALAHRVGDATTKAYRRKDALEKRRALMNDWAAFSMQ